MDARRSRRGCFRLPSCRGAGLVPVVLFGVLLPLAPDAQAQVAPVIQHEGIQCFLYDRYLELSAIITPATDVRVARVYFRADLYPEFYYVEMTAEEEDVFRAVLPKPSPETQRLRYYIEAVTTAFDTARTIEHTPQIVPSEDQCERRGPNPVYFTGTNPGVIVGATRAGAPALPPGFSASGIISTISSSGIVSGAGGGLGPGGILGIGAAAGAAGGAAILVGGGDNDTGTTAPPPPSTISTTTTTATVEPPPGNPAPQACFVTTPNPPVIQVGQSVLFDANCSRADRMQQADEIVSYEWNFGDGSPPARGRTASHTYTAVGIFRATLTVVDQGGTPDSTFQDVTVTQGPAPPTTTTVPITTTATSTSTTSTSTTSTTSTTTTSIPVADIQVRKFGPSNATAGVPFDYRVEVTNLGPNNSGSVTLVDRVSPVGNVNITNVSFDTPPFSGCDRGSSVVTCTAPTMTAGVTGVIIITATISANVSNTATATATTPPDDPTGNNTATLNTVASLTVLSSEAGSTDASIASHLEILPPDGRIKAQVIFNGSRIDTVDNGAPYRHQITGRVGDNLLEATVLNESQEGGRWRFDFRDTSLEPGSLAVESGQVLSLGAKEVVVRVSGGPGELFRIRFRLRAP